MSNRRQFLRMLSALGLSPLVPGCGSGSKEGMSDGDQTGPTTTYSPSLWRGSHTEIGGPDAADEALSVLEGQLPDDMLGHVLINASVPRDPALPLLAGEGVVYRLSFEAGARIKTRVLRTDDYYVAEKVRQTPDDFGILFDIAQFSPTFGARNLANTALLPIMNGRLLATYDMGRPIEIDPVTLNVVTPVGLQDSWRPSMDKGLFTMHFVTAHPAYDADEQRVYAINYGLSVLAKFLRIVRWDGATEPAFFDVEDEQGNAVVLSMLGHQMQVTKSFIVVLDGAFDVLGSTPPTMSPVWLIPKSSLKSGQKALAKKVLIPRECTHFLADRNDEGDSVRILLMHHNGTNTGGHLMPGDVGYRSQKPIPLTSFRAGSDRNVLGQYTIDFHTGKVDSLLLSTDDTWGVGLWGQDPRQWTKLGTAYYQTSGFDAAYLPKREADRYKDYPFGAGFSREVPFDQLPQKPMPRKLVHIDHESQKVLQTFVLENNQLASSPTFVPRKNRTSDDDGYLVVTMAGDVRDEIWVFDATDLARGPLVKLGHPELDFPFTLHSTWLEDLAPRPSDGYKLDRAVDYKDRLAALDADKRKLAEDALGIG